MSRAARQLRIVLLFVVAVAGARPAGAEDKPKECIYVANESKMVRLALPVVAFSGLGAAAQREPIVLDEKYIRDEKYQFGGLPCTAPGAKFRLTENERPVIAGGNVTTMTVEGDICGRSPRFVIYDAQLLIHVYSFVTKTGELSTHPMARRVAAAALVVQRRCGRIPDELRFTARLTGEAPPTTYSSHVDTKAGFAIIPDDRAQEERYHLAQRQYQDAAKRAREEAEYKATLGGLLVLLGYGFIMMQKKEP
jgi:hypothetical protein